MHLTPNLQVTAAQGVAVVREEVVVMLTDCVSLLMGRRGA